MERTVSTGHASRRPTHRLAAQTRNGVEVLQEKGLKIAVIGTRGIPSNYSGIERAAESLYVRLAARGHRVTVYCRPECLPKDTDYYRGIRLVGVHTFNRKAIESVVHSFSSVLHATLIERYDVIHLHALAAGLFTRIAPLRGVPAVVTIHGLDWQRAKWKGLASSVLRIGERSIARNATAIIAVSRDLQRHFEREYGLEVAYIPNGIEHSLPTDRERHLVEEFHLCRGRYIIYAGRLVPEKRIEDLIAAFRRLRTAYKLAIVGEGGYTGGYVEELRKLAEDDPRVVFTGLQRGAALEALYDGAVAFVLPSDLEGLPMSLLEALEHGIPAVVSDIPPHRELLGTVKGYDLFVRCRDVDGLTDSLQRVLTNREYYAEVASRARAQVRTCYSWDANAEATERLFQAVVRDGRHGKRHAGS